MSKKIILSLLILSLVNIPTLAKEEIQTIKLDENTIDLNVDILKERSRTIPPLTLEFDTTEVQNVIEEKIEQTTETLEKVQEQAEQIEEVKQVVEEKVQEEVEQVEEVKTVVEEKFQEQAKQIEEVKETVKEIPTVIETEEIRGLTPIEMTTPENSKSQVENIMANAETEDGEIRLDSTATNSAIKTVTPADAPKWEEFCEIGYENASKKEKENIFSIINFVNAQRIKNNYWAERRENFEKAINHCNSLEENARNYCYEGVRKTETEKNEFYEQQRKDTNYKNQGIRVDK